MNHATILSSITLFLLLSITNPSKAMAAGELVRDPFHIALLDFLLTCPLSAPSAMHTIHIVDRQAVDAQTFFTLSIERANQLDNNPVRKKLMFDHNTGQLTDITHAHH